MRIYKEYQLFQNVSNIFQKNISVIYIEIDAAKDINDCFITNSNGKVLFSSFNSFSKQDIFEACLAN